MLTSSVTLLSGFTSQEEMIIAKLVNAVVELGTLLFTRAVKLIFSFSLMPRESNCQRSALGSLLVGAKLKSSSGVTNSDMIFCKRTLKAVLGPRFVIVRE